MEFPAFFHQRSWLILRIWAVLRSLVLPRFLKSVSFPPNCFATMSTRQPFPHLEFFALLVPRFAGKERMGGQARSLIGFSHDSRFSQTPQTPNQRVTLSPFTRCTGERCVCFFAAIPLGNSKGSFSLSFTSAVYWSLTSPFTLFGLCSCPSSLLSFFSISSLHQPRQLRRRADFWVSVGDAIQLATHLSTLIFAGLQRREDCCRGMGRARGEKGLVVRRKKQRKREVRWR